MLYYTLEKAYPVSVVYALGIAADRAWKEKV